MTRVFISYRRADTAGHAGRLYDELCDRFGRAQVFRDIDTIAPGADFVRAIEQAIGSSDALLVVIGKRWATESDARRGRRLHDPNDYVRLELLTAQKQGAVVLPVLVDGARMPSPSSLPVELAGLARLNAIELTDARWDFDVQRLVEAVQGQSRHPEDAEREQATAPPAPTAPLGAAGPAAPPARRTSAPAATRRLAAVAISVAALLVAVLVLLRPGLSGPAANPASPTQQSASPSIPGETPPTNPTLAARAPTTSQVLPSATPILPDGLPVAVTTLQPGQQVRLAFNGRAGERISVVQRDTRGTAGPSIQPGCLDTVARLLRPNGRELITAYSCEFIPATPLAADGTYIIEVGHPDGGPVDLTLELYRVPPDIVGTIVAGGPGVLVRTEAPGQNARLTFDGKAGQRIGLSHIDAAQRPGPSSLDGCADTFTRLLRPDGQDLGEIWACGVLDPVRLPVDGTYAVEIQPVNARTIDLTVLLFEVPAS